jgi:hypothetical protein
MLPIINFTFIDCEDCYSDKQKTCFNQMTYCDRIYTCKECCAEVHINDIDHYYEKIIFNYKEFVLFLRQQSEKTAKKYIIKYLLWVCSYNNMPIYNKEYDKNIIQSYYDEIVKVEVAFNNFTLFCEYNID